MYNYISDPNIIVINVLDNRQQYCLEDQGSELKCER